MELLPHKNILKENELRSLTALQIIEKIRDPPKYPPRHSSIMAMRS